MRRNDTTNTNAPDGQPTTMNYKTIGPYDVVRLIGEGGMGRVFLAHDPMLDRNVAVKVLSSSAPVGEEVARYEREAKALAPARIAPGEASSVLSGGWADGQRQPTREAIAFFTSC